jgi:signal transduction histidine kinase
MSASLQLTSAMLAVPAELAVKPRLDRVLQVIEQGIQEGRSAILGLRLVEANTADLVAALSRSAGTRRFT